MRLTLLGVRGSTPAPGAEFVRYGGHTSCVAVAPDPAGPPTLVIDAGTGIRGLGRLLSGRPFRGDIVLTHLHWDHVQGLPFCPVIDHPEAVVRLHVPVADADEDPVATLRRGMSPPTFPIGPEGLLGSWEIVPLLPGPAKVDADVGVAVARIRHKGGPTYGVRVTGPSVRSFAYLPDHRVAGPDVDGHDLVAGCDLLLHDGQFTATEAGLAAAYGHTTVWDALTYADRCAVRELLVVHHHPDRTDDALDALLARHPRTPGGRPVRFAVEGEVVDV